MGQCRKKYVETLPQAGVYRQIIRHRRTRADQELPEHRGKGGRKRLGNPGNGQNKADLSL
jgi:hypothetical protein